MRNTSPVFVVGCHRSGTNLLYDTLLSAGGFAIYRGYLPVYKMLVPKFGAMNNTANRRRIVDTWLRSKGYRRSGLDAMLLRRKLLAEAVSAGDFMRIVMNQICASQGVSRWALYDADNLLYISKIKRDIPEAIFVHIIRDGRDIALSLKTMGGFTPFFWNRRPGSLDETAIYWQWMVRKGREQGCKFPADYIEVHYEDLVTNPAETLQRLGQFIDQELDYGRIQSASLGSLRSANSSFNEESARNTPVNRWKQVLSSREVSQLEDLIGDLLEELGYALTCPRARPAQSYARHWTRPLYTSFLEAKLWAKINTPLGRLTSIAPLELDYGASVASNSVL
jgi:hypothetical protein